jgi:hypothetical protein
LGGKKAQGNFEQTHISNSSPNASLSQINLSAAGPEFGKPSTHAADLGGKVSLNTDIEPRKKDRLGLPSPEAIPEPTLIRATAFGPVPQSNINPRATRNLQYIGLFGNNSHPQTSVKVSQKGSHLRSHSTESNPEAENGVHKNSDAHLRYSHKQIYKNIAIGDGTILIDEKGQPMGVSLIRNFTASATNIEVQIPFGTNSDG